MKIDSSAKPAGAPPVKEAKAPVMEKSTAATGDEVRLSALAAQLSTSGNEPVFDSARVAEIKQAISDGRFTINAGAIADRLIASAQELVSSQRPS
ncbi:MAG: flagellar biosynthesis anti-sigma factor FlgM [Propionivibrio sp.]